MGDRVFRIAYREKNVPGLPGPWKTFTTCSRGAAIYPQASTAKSVMVRKSKSFKQRYEWEVQELIGEWVSVD